MAAGEHLRGGDVNDMSIGLRSAVDRTVQRLADWRDSSPRWFATVVVVIAVGIALGSRFPSYTGGDEQAPQNILTVARTTYGRAITWWLEHPFQAVPIADFYPNAGQATGVAAGEVSHLAKLGVRGTLPLLNQVLHGGLGTILLASHVAAMWAFLLFYRIGREATGDAAYAALATWAFAAAWAGQWGFQDFICGDMVAVALLLACCRAGGITATVLLVVAGFVDERAIAGAPLVALLRVALAGLASTDAASRRRQGWRPAVLPVVVGIGLYGVGRIALAAGGHGAGDWSMVGGTEILLFHLFASFPTKVFRVWEFLWLLPMALVLLLATSAVRAHRIRAAWYAFATACAAAPALLVWDVERSLTYCAPGVLLAVVTVPLSAASRRRLLLAVALASIAWIELTATPLRYLIY